MSTKIHEQEEVEIITTSIKNWRVILHNDNFTAMEMVIRILMMLFEKDYNTAIKITMQVHKEGAGIAGVYMHEIAEQKMHEAIHMARSFGYPLQVTIEEE